MQLRIVVDTSVFVSALISADGASREVLRRCLLGKVLPVMGDKLFCEFEDVIHRPEVVKRCKLTEREREELLDAFIAKAELTAIFFLWRPNLRDENDNHLVELAVAASADVIVTHNIADFDGSELKFDFEVMTPGKFLKRNE